jgi:hypothetical protein
MLQAIGEKLVCVYGRGTGHTIASDDRAVYARTSTDGGKTWTAETVVADAKDYGEVAVGKGRDATGAMLLWVRRIGKKEWNHDLYRSTDGITFTLIATPTLAVRPMQITDVFSVPKVGLMALWFGADYSDNPALPEPPAGWDAKRDNIPYGKLGMISYDSKTVGTRRKMNVYTPPGYSTEKKYPVLYLLPDPAAAQPLKLLWLSCGNRDGLLHISQELHAEMTAKNVAHIWHVTDHAHEAPRWKQALYWFVQKPAFTWLSC